MKKFYCIILFISLFNYLESYSQKHFNNWYFGINAGITFNTSSGEPKALTDGALNTKEGCSTISDKDGNLLFYTDGTKVWNRLHLIMKNGEDLLGDYSTSQSALIVPKPGLNSLYYIFTVDDDDQRSNSKGLNYSIVDISLKNGFGAVTEKNIHLLDLTTERLAAIGHPNEKDVWIVTQDLNDKCFVTYLLTENGLQVNPQKSPCSFNFEDYQAGNMKFSPDGKKLVFTYHERNLVQIYDFNDLTGKISNEKIIETTQSPYGIEFSPNSKLIYVAGNEGFKVHYIYQYDITSNNTNEIKNSEKHIFTSNSGNNFWAMQMAPNGKIYLVCNSEYLSVINQPDLLDLSCDFRLNAVYLDGKNTLIGLPSVVQKSNPKSNFNFQSKIIICEGETIDLTLPLDLEDNYIWQGPLGFSSEEHNPYIYNAKTEMSGIYTYKIFHDDIMIYDGFINVTVNPKEKILFKDTTDLVLCTNPFNLKAVENNENVSLTWSGINSLNNIVTITKNGTYKVYSENKFGCRDTASINITFHEPYCEGNTILINTKEINNAEYVWSGPNEFEVKAKDLIIPNASVNNSGDYILKVLVKSDNGDDEDKITYHRVQIIIYPKEKILFSDIDELYFCNDSLELFAVGNPDGCKFNWKGIESNENKAVIKASGIYKVFVENKYGCVDSATINIHKNERLNAKIVSDKKNILCKDDNINLSSNNDFFSYKWSTGETTKSISIHSAGYYYLIVTDSKGCTDSTGITINDFGNDILISETEYNFGNVNTGKISPFEFSIENKEIFDIKIQNIYVKNNNAHFNIIKPTMPFILKSNDKTIITVNFIPKNELNLLDSIVVELSEPCNITKYIKLTGVSKGLILVDFWLPDTTADIGTVNYSLPIYIKLRDHSDIDFKTNIKTKIKFLRTLYKADTTTNSQFSNQINYDSSTFIIEFKDIKISNEINIISNFIGYILHTTKGFTNITIEEIEFSDSFLIPVPKNGSLKTNQVCIQNLKGIKLREGSYLSLNYKNNQSNAVAYCSTSDNYHFSIYNITGELIYNFNWKSESKSEKNFELSDIVNYSGLYFITLSSQDFFDIQQIPIIK